MVTPFQLVRDNKTMKPVVLGALSIIVALLGCTNEPPTENVGGIDNQSMQRRIIVHDGIEREYFVHVPPRITYPAPVVYAVHGYTSTATGFEAAHNLNPHADEKGYVVVYPQGTHFVVDSAGGQRYRVTSWNDLAANMGPAAEGPHCVEDAFNYPCPPECGECNRCAWTGCYDDLGFFEKMLDEVHAEFSTDAKRTYLLGVSNGGMMALRLGCNLSERFAAIAPIIAQLAPGYACGPSVDIPMLHLFGDADDTVRFDGKPGADGFVYTSAEKTAKVWADHLSCDTGPAPWENDFSRTVGLNCIAYADCRIAGQEVVSCVQPGGGHNWPGQEMRSVSATCVTVQQQESIPDQALCPDAGDEVKRAGMDVVWDFFSRYPVAE